MQKYIPFDKDGVHVIALAQREAERWGRDYVEPEHLLLSLLHEPQCRAYRALVILGVDIEKLRRQTEERLMSGPGRQAPRMHLTDRTKHVVNFWPEEAVRMGNDYVGTEHQFLGLIHRAGGVVAEVFDQQDINEDTFRTQVTALQ